MGDRNIASRMFLGGMRNHLDNDDDDDLAPVVLAVDAVQLLMEQEQRNKSNRSTKFSTKRDELERSHSTQNDTDSKGSEPVTQQSSDSKTESDDPKPSTSSMVVSDVVYENSPPKVGSPTMRQNEKIPTQQRATLPKPSGDPIIRRTTPPSRGPGQDLYLVRNEHPAPRIRLQQQQQKQEDYEFIPKSVILDVYSNDPEVKRFLKQLPKIGNEFGLNEQDYKCYSCRRPIGMVFGQPRLCHFDGHHYCSECHLGEKSVIPARILCNWDFNKYPISKRNQHFLNLISNEPMFELKVMAPLLYKTCPELIEMEQFRYQAFFIRSYCFTCAEPNISLDLTKLVWPREHLIKQTDSYSLEDMIQIKSGALKQVLKNVITFGRQHVLSCVLCCQKGFICELCKSSQIIYPFDIDSVHRCNSCQSIYHKACYKTNSSSESCPRCQRLKARRNEG